jgi:glycosyltransferase involved in cell wall biosynthesis
MNRKYVLLTAAKDEEKYIEEVLKAVVAQTVLPLAWFIMDDGSTDRTASIVQRYAAVYPFIHLQSASERKGRNFGSQYKAINAAYDFAKNLDFDFLGVVDADQAPESSHYYEEIFSEFDRNPKLGMASGFIYERTNGESGEWKNRPGNSRDSTCASAVFRRTCYEKIGGYLPLVYGGSDALAQIDAKRNGFEIFTRPDLVIFHYRPTSSAGGIWKGLFRGGMMDASFGTLFIFEVLKCLRRVKARPRVLGSAVRFGGYLYWRLSGRAPLLSGEQVDFLRKDQVAKIRSGTSRVKGRRIVSEI